MKLCTGCLLYVFKLPCVFHPLEILHETLTRCNRSAFMCKLSQCPSSSPYCQDTGLASYFSVRVLLSWTCELCALALECTRPEPFPCPYMGNAHKRREQQGEVPWTSSNENFHTVCAGFKTCDPAALASSVLELWICIAPLELWICIAPPETIVPSDIKCS